MTADQLEGRSFVSTAVEGQTLVADTTITLTFEDDRVGVTAGCNTMSGPYRVEAGTLRADQMISTLMGCPDNLAAQDEWVAALLTDGAAVGLEGDTLTLTGPDVTVTLAASPTDSIEGRAWSITALEGPDGTQEAPEGASLTLADGSVAVATGCNRAMGPATLDGDTLTIGPLASTRMACPTSARGKGPCSAFLDGDLTVAVDGDQLTLTKGDETLSLTEVP